MPKKPNNLSNPKLRFRLPPIRFRVDLTTAPQHVAIIANKREFGGK